jgi:hypothetical protein
LPGQFHRLVGIALERDRPAAAHAFVGGNEDAGVAVDDTAGQRIGREAAEHHRVHRADAGARQHGVGRFRDHRHVDGHPVAFLDAAGLQDVGEAAHLFVQLAIGDLPVVRRVVALPDDGDLVGARLEVAVDAVVGDVRHAVMEPANRYVGIGEIDVLDLAVGLEPVDALALLGPEPFRVADGLGVHLRVALRVDVGALRPFGGNFVDLAFRHRRPPLPC